MHSSFRALQSTIFKFLPFATLFMQQRLCDLLFKFIDPAYQQCYTQKESEQLLKTIGFDVVKDSKVHFGFIWELIALDAFHEN